MKEYIELGDSGELLVRVAYRGAAIILAQLKGVDYFFPYVKLDGGKERGWMHPCSPIFGRKIDLDYGRLPQHGGLRTETWIIKTQTEHSVCLACDFRRYPYHLLYEVVYTVEGKVLTIGMEAVNKGERDVPFEFVWHTYYNAPAGGFVSIQDIDEPIHVDGKIGPDVYRAKETVLVSLEGIGSVRTTLGREFHDQFVCVWSDGLGGYFCVEPGVRHPDLFNRSGGLFLVQNRTFAASLEMTFE